ncbi:MAG TPA: cytochrome-c oxidase, cbb3-type subunit III [Steroidobacteraceae bacterium]
MTPLASALVAAATLLNILGILWLLWWTRKDRTGKAQTETTGHVWDDDLREYNNPLPRWWLGLFLISVVFGLTYLAIYPGLGNFPGLKGWSQEEQYRQQSEQAEALLAKTFARFEAQDLATLVQDPEALRVGRNLFLNNCAACHGSDGRGAPGFPNLTDNDWLWGGTPEAIMESIRNGRTGTMMAWQPVIGRAAVEDVLAYVMSLSGRKLPAGDAAAGKKTFEQMCSACHGMDGKGNQQLGAPNLTDQIWLHGGSVAAVRETIANGRQGEMPAHLDRLGETRTRLIAAYVLSLGGAEQPEESGESRVTAVTASVP